MDAQEIMGPPKTQPLIFGHLRETMDVPTQNEAYNSQEQSMEQHLPSEVNHRSKLEFSLEMAVATAVAAPNVDIENNTEAALLSNNKNEESAPFLNNPPVQTFTGGNINKHSPADSFKLSESHASDLEKQGKYSEAAELYNTILKEFNDNDELDSAEIKSTFCEERSLKLRNSLAILYCRLGKYTEAIEMFSHILHALENVQVDKLNILNYFEMEQAVKNNLGLALNFLGMYDESYSIFLDVLQRRVDTLATNHPDILATKHNLALVLKNQGKNKEALKFYNEVLSSREEMLGPDHLDTLSTRLNMASVLTSLGQYETALDSLSQVLEKHKIILGKAHPQTLKTAHNIAVILTLQQNYIQALKLNKEIINNRKEILGKDHPETLTTVHNAAISIHAQGNYRRPLRKHQYISQHLQKLFSQNPQHPFILTNDLNMASVLVSQRQYKTALNEIERVVQRQELTSWGINHPDTILAKFNKASALVSLKRFEEARKVFSSISGKSDDELFCGEGLKTSQLLKKQEQCKAILESAKSASIWSKCFHFICG